MKNIILIEVEQPIGTFYLGKISVSDLKQFAKISRRNLRNEGHQRILKPSKVKDIAYYCKDPDAAFPTPIIISIKTDIQLTKVQDSVFSFVYNEKDIEAEIIDGQHRFEGIIDSGQLEIEVPIAIMFNLNDSQKAYIFSTINNNQAKVDKSLIYDLFGVQPHRSPYKTCHEIARILNEREDSPLCGRIKMLEKRQSKEESLSQGTLVTHLLKLITTSPNADTVDSKNDEEIKGNQNLPFREFYKNNKDEIIVKILLNFFNAARRVFLQEWNNPDKYILTKTTGYSGLVKALKTIIQKGKDSGDLTESFFEGIFLRFKKLLDDSNLELTSEHFPPGATTETKISEMLCKCI